MALAENIAKSRKAKGMSQQELADRTGVSQVAISFFELGKKVPSVAVLERIADVLGCSIDTLMGRQAPNKQ